MHVNGSIRGNQNGALRLNTGNGYVDIGPKNADWSHFVTDRPRYYFNKEIRVNSGKIGSYAEDLSLCTSGTERITVKRSNGYVGIGTTDPKEKLHVDGNVRIGGSRTKLYGRELVESTYDWQTYIHWIEASYNKVLGFKTTYYRGAIPTRRSVIVHDDCYFYAKNKNFLIEHPLDPEHKYLTHSTLEGPEVGVFYRGEAQLSNGEATIQLPDYFEALTRKENRTVLITPKFEGDDQVSMLAASGVKYGKFTVRMIDRKNPSQKFYWEVKAVRADVGILEVEQVKTS